MKLRKQPSPAPRTVPRARGRRSAGGTLVGIFVGLVLGLMLAAAVAYFFLRGANPYHVTAPAAVKDATRDSSRPGRPDAAIPDKPRFDFYRIVPGTDDPKPQPKAPEKATQERTVPEHAAPVEKAVPAPTDPGAAKASERFWLQAGSFGAEADADHLKAQLALSGWEASVQSVTLPEKGVRYRVRLGPYDNTDELNRVKDELSRRGFEVAVIRY